MFTIIVFTIIVFIIIVFTIIIFRPNFLFFSSGAFNKKYRLLSPSSTVAATKALIDKDFVTSENGHYRVYDRFFALWLKERS